MSVATGGSQVTIAVSFPGSATLSLDRGHLIFGGSVSEIDSWKIARIRGFCRKEISTNFSDNVIEFNRAQYEDRKTAETQEVTLVFV